jgi:toxin ParE1/3/4
VQRLRITPRATLDLIEIWNYIADDSLENADRFIDELYETIGQLSRHPGMGRQREELAPGLRSFPHHRHVIFYKADSNSVDIVRVLHGARDVRGGFEEGVPETGQES